MNISSNTFRRDLENSSRCANMSGTQVLEPKALGGHDVHLLDRESCLQRNDYPL